MGYTYVLSDVHGQLDCFESVLAKINLQPDDTLYVLGDVIETAKANGTVISQTWEASDDDSFIEDSDSLRSCWYFRVPADADIDMGGTYTHEDGISYVTDKEMTFAEAKAEAEKVGALAFMPVME